MNGFSQRSFPPSFARCFPFSPSVFNRFVLSVLQHERYSQKMNVIQEISRLRQLELENGVSAAASWHAKYKNSAYIYIGGLDYDLTEGDIIMIFSQFGEVVDCNLIRDQITGKSKGFCFLAYEGERFPYRWFFHAFSVCRSAEYSAGD